MQGLHEWMAFFGYYVLVVSFAIFVYKKQLSGLQIAAALTTKIIAACLFGYLFLHYANGAVIDTWYYHQEGLKEWQLLQQNPIQFFRKDIIDHGYTEASSSTVFHQQNSFAKDLQHNLLIKLVAILHALSGGNYYINALLYASLCFPACVWLYKLGVSVKPMHTKHLYLVCFFVPSFLFWNSGIMKDGITVLFAVACLYSMVRFHKTWAVKYLVFTVLAWVACFALRQFTALSLLPAFLAYWLQARTNMRSFFVVVIVLLPCIIVFFINAYWWPYPVNFAQKILERTQAFSALAAGSSLYLPSPSNLSFFMSAFPFAIKNVLLAPLLPLPTQWQNIVAAVYHVCFCSFCVFAWFQGGKKLIAPLLPAILVIICINLLLIGYTVPVAGAIVRYRSWLEWLLLFCISLRRTN